MKIVDLENKKYYILKYQDAKDLKPVEINSVQKWILQREGYFEFLYWSVWIIVLIISVINVIRFILKNK